MSEWLMDILYGVGYIVLAPIIGGLLAGLDRIIAARMQRRVGPPLLQPFYDVAKLWGKEPIAINEAQGFYICGFLLFVIISGLFFFTQGDILLVVFTLTMASVCFVVAAYASNSPYSQLSAERELMQTMAYEPMLLLVAIGFYLSCGTFNLADIMHSPQMNIITMPGLFLGLNYVLIIKFRKSPYDISMSHEIHQELIQGMVTELSGRDLARVEVAHWYENIFLLGFVYLFFAHQASWSPILGVVMSLLVFFSDTLIDNCCSRVKWQRMLVSCWLVTLVLGFTNIAFLMYMK